jgi:predicted Zn-ribbon and HTH transcriptional regulator
MIAVADLIEVHGGDVDVDAVERAARCSRCKTKSIRSTKIFMLAVVG